jgi:predicted transcriptional regulator
MTPLQKNKFTKTKSVRISNEHKKMVAEMATIEKRTEQCILELSIEAKYKLVKPCTTN